MHTKKKEKKKDTSVEHTDPNVLQGYLSKMFRTVKNKINDRRL